MLIRRQLSKIQPIDLCRQDEVALRQPLDFMREDLDPDFAPGKRQVRMMALLLGHLPHAIDVVESLPEVREEKALFEVVLLDDLPIGNLGRQFPEFLSLQRRRAAHAGNAFLIRERYLRSTHTSPSLTSTG